MEQQDEFNADALFNGGSLPQIDPDVNLEAFDAVQLPANPFVVERVLNLQHSGCLDRIAWSKQGHIASIGDDGTSVDLHCLRFDNKTRTWTLSSKQTAHIGLGELASLVWSPLATDLAIADINGRISIWRPGRPSWNKLTEARSGVQDETDAQTQLIGLHWLGQERLNTPREIVQYANKTGTSWAQHRARASPLGPLYSRAVVSVDRRGRLSVIYERLDSSFGRVSTALVEDADVPYTHAAFAPTSENKLLVVLASRDGSMPAWWIGMDFSELRQSSEGHPKPPGSLRLSAELATTNLAATVLPNVEGELYDPSCYGLTHLGIIPTSEVYEAEKPPPTVYAVYANCSRNLSPTDPGYLAAGMVRQWTISSVIEELHPRFNDLSTKSAEPIAKLSSSIARAADKDESVITSIIHLDNRLGLFVTTLDGRSDFLRIDDLSHDLSPLSYAMSEDETSSLPQSGFAFPLNPHPSHTALSPSGCVLASLTPDGRAPSLLTMEFPSNTGASPNALLPTSAASSAAIASLILSFSRCVWTNISIEDILSLILTTLPPSFSGPIIMSLYRTLFRETEFISEQFKGPASMGSPAATAETPTSELEKVVQKLGLSKVLSFHYAVSFLAVKGKDLASKEGLCNKWVWVAANLRSVAQVVVFHVRDRQMSNTWAAPEIADVICGNIKWTLDLLRYMVEYILQVGDRESNPDCFEPVNEAEGESADGSQGLVPLLINCHWTRHMLLAILKFLKALYKAPESRHPPAVQVVNQVAREIHNGTVGKGVPMGVLEAMLKPDWVTQADLTPTGAPEQSARVLSQRQIEMMSTGIVCDTYAGTVKQLSEKLFDGLREKKPQMDRLKLWLSRVKTEDVLLVDGKAEGWVWDVHSKKKIWEGVRESDTNTEPTEHMMIKTCVRCGRHSGSMPGPKTGVNKYMLHLFSRCICDGPFVVEKWDDVMSSVP
ncbi:hypothetical protein DV738_g1509, partial [Chaetothyriales sp. CBS 135597]